MTHTHYRCSVGKASDAMHHAITTYCISYSYMVGKWEKPGPPGFTHSFLDPASGVNEQQSHGGIYWGEYERENDTETAA